MKEIECPYCKGTGVDEAGKVCHICDGAKVVSVKEAKPEPKEVSEDASPKSEAKKSKKKR